MSSNDDYLLKNERNSIISIICPSRRRPSQLLNMMNSATNKSTAPQNLEFCIYIDEDDESYNFGHIDFSKFKIQTLRGPRFWLSGMFNSLLTVASGDYIFYCGDDVEFKTVGWDLSMKKEIDKFKDKLCVVYVNDLAKYEQKYATIGMVHKSWVNVYGHIFTPHMRDNGIDFWISEVASCVGRLKYLPEVHIEHLQFRQGKGEIDETYMDRVKSHKIYSPAALYASLKDERQRDKLILSFRLQTPLKEKSLRYFCANMYIFLIEKLGNKKFLTSELIYIKSISNIKFVKKISFKLITPLNSIKKFFQSV